MNNIIDIRIDEVVDEHPRMGRRNLDTVRKVVYKTRVFSQTTGMWYDREGHIVVAVGYRGAFDGNGADVYKTPGGSRIIYQADMVIMTRFTSDMFAVVKNRWGIDSVRFDKGLDLGMFLIGRGLDGFGIEDRELIWENVLQALSDVTGHPKEYIRNKERFILNRSMRPRYYTKPLEFGYGT